MAESRVYCLLERRLLAHFGVVPDVDALHQEQHILGDVGGVVGDALQVVGDEHQVHGARNGGALFLHEGHQFLVNRVAQAIHLVIRQQDAAGQIFVALDQRIQALAHHVFGQAGHLRNVDQRLYRRLPHQRQARWVMFTARSPMRSRSPLILITAVRKRMSRAMG